MIRYQYDLHEHVYVFCTSGEVDGGFRLMTSTFRSSHFPQPEKLDVVTVR